MQLEQLSPIVVTRHVGLEEPPTVVEARHAEEASARLGASAGSCASAERDEHHLACIDYVDTCVMVISSMCLRVKLSSR